MMRALCLCAFLCGAALAGDAEVDKWIKVMATPAEGARYTALNKLVDLGARSIPACRKLLANKSEGAERRYFAAKVLGAVKAKEAIEDLLLGLEDRIFGVVVCSAEALGNIGDRSVIPKLKAFKDRTRDPRIKTAIDGALQKLKAGVATTALRFETDPRAALARAAKEGKLVLTMVRGAFGNNSKLVFPEETLFAVALYHPDVVALVRNRFVPLRMAYTPWLHTIQQRDSRDPLPAIGTTAAKAKAPALVVSTSKGKHVVTLSSIGTYDPWLVFSFLARAAGKKRMRDADPATLLANGQLDAAQRAARKQKGAEGTYWLARVHGLSGNPAAVLKVKGKGGDFAVETGIAQMRLGQFKRAQETLTGALTRRGTRQDEARYYLGCMVYRGGDHEGGKRHWQSIAGESPWFYKANARLKWPERMDMFECLRAPDISARMLSTEVPQGRGVIQRALRYLTGQQQPDGSWVNPTRYKTTEAAITALCARALFEHGADKDAVERATAWLRAYMKREKPADANGWSAAYTLEYFLARLRQDGKFRKDAQAAVDFVLGGQAPNGAWSYSRNWGMRWKGGFGGWPKTDEGRYHSMNTGPSLVALTTARDIGLKVNDAALERGKQVLLKMRDAPTIWTYTYPGPRNFNEKPEHSIGRAPGCELALHRLGGSPKRDLVQTMKVFMAHRKGLRHSVKLNASWMPPQMASSYFYHFAYFSADAALEALGDRKSRAVLQKDLLSVAEADGTWVDYEQTGKPYATAMALLVLR